MNPSKYPNWGFDTFIIFPNFQVQLWSTGWYLATSFWPLAVDRVLMQRRVYFPPPKNAGERFAQEFSKRTNRDVNMEDLSTLEYTQEGLASGALTHVLLQPES